MTINRPGRQDGRRIAFVSERDGNPEIYVMNADGSQQTRLTTDSLPDFSPAWSPDGRHIVRVQAVNQYHGSLFSMDANGLHQNLLISNLGYLESATYSPSGGTKVAVTFDENLDGWLYLYNFDLSSRHRTLVALGGTGQDSQNIWGYDQKMATWVTSEDFNFLHNPIYLQQ